jgi:hypothetical protein
LVMSVQGKHAPEGTSVQRKGHGGGAVMFRVQPLQASTACGKRSMRRSLYLNRGIATPFQHFRRAPWRSELRAEQVPILAKVVERFARIER